MEIRYWPYEKRFWLALVGALLSAWIVLEVLDPYPASWLWRKLFGDSYVVNITLDLGVEGKRSQFNRAVRCLEYFSFGNPMTGGSGTARHLGVEAIGWDLRAGTGLLLVVPWVCDLKSRSADVEANAISGPKPIAVDHLPLIARTESTGEQRVVEAYVSLAAYAGSKARIEFHSISAQVGGLFSFPDERDQFEWFRESTGGPFKSRTETRQLLSIYALEVPEPVWRNEPELVAFASDSQSPRFLTDQLTGIVADSDWRPELPRWEDLMLGLGVPPGPTPAGARRDLGPNVRRTFDSVIPLRFDGEAFVLSPEEAGLAIFYSSPIGDKYYLSEHRYKINDIIIETNRQTAAILYQPDTKKMYWLRRQRFLPRNRR